MTNPVLVEVLRGGLVESRHRGSVAVFDAAGKSVLSIGDVERPVFPRSAVKAIQALPLVESGAAEPIGFGDQRTGAGLRLAFRRAGACGARRPTCWRKASLDGSALECGAQWPLDQEATVALARSGRHAVGAAQQLLGQAFRLPVRLPPSADRSSQAMSAPIIPTRSWCAERWPRSPAPSTASATAASTAARSRPTRCR